MLIDKNVIMQTISKTITDAMAAAKPMLENLMKNGASTKHIQHQFVVSSLMSMRVHPVCELHSFVCLYRFNHCWGQGFDH